MIPRIAANYNRMTEKVKNEGVAMSQSNSRPQFCGARAVTQHLSTNKSGPEFFDIKVRD